jgi:hypothetical protein
MKLFSMFALAAALGVAAPAGFASVGTAVTIDKQQHFSASTQPMVHPCCVPYER